MDTAVPSVPPRIGCVAAGRAAVVASTTVAHPPPLGKRQGRGMECAMLAASAIARAARSLNADNVGPASGGRGMRRSHGVVSTAFGGSILILDTVGGGRSCRAPGRLANQHARA